MSKTGVDATACSTAAARFGESFRGGWVFTGGLGVVYHTTGARGIKMNK
jgi:hypothetical protein